MHKVRTPFIVLAGLGFGVVCISIYFAMKPNPEHVRLAKQFNATVEEVAMLQEIEGKVDERGYEFPSDVELLEVLVRSKSETIQYKACRLLGFVGKVGEMERCARILYNVASDESESDNIRYKALHALDKLAHDKALEVANANKGAEGENFGNAVDQLLSGMKVGFTNAELGKEESVQSR